ncbi:MAG: hypothetical protein EPN92_03260 [Chitinophagaceae bacterium]|nr:MAG: hypothetical protein EPN92_03260 [Chitinophagaceae bacterium]
MFRILTYRKINCLKKCVAIPALLLFLHYANAQTVRRPVAALYTGLGAYSTNHADVFSFTSNQASLAQLSNAAAGVYGEKRFLLDELSLYQAAVAVPTSSGNFGLKAGYYGYNDYNETQLGLAYARKLGSKVDIGVQFNYNAVRINSYGNASAVNFEIGTILHLTDKLHAGVHAYNPVGGKLGKNGEEKLASVYTVGLGYEASEKFFVSAEVEKEENQDVNINAGMQYKFLPQLMARAGIATNTSNVYFGVGLFLKSFRLDVVASYHPQLGVTPGLLLIYDFKKK